MVCSQENKLIKDFGDIAYAMWEQGWDEYNGGNISYLLDNDELETFKETLVGFRENFNTADEKLRCFEVSNVPTAMIGKCLLISASGSHFRVLKRNVQRDAGIIRITKIGYSILWGFELGHKPTSEIHVHILAHHARLQVDPQHRVVCHNHATDVVAYSLTVEPNDKSFTLPLWQVLTESVVVFPDGVGSFQWEVPGTTPLGLQTAEKLKKCRIVAWTNHGVLSTGKSFQDCFGLIETVNKAAHIALMTNGQRAHQLDCEKVKRVCKQMGVQPREGLLD